MPSGAFHLRTRPARDFLFFERTLAEIPRDNSIPSTRRRPPPAWARRARHPPLDAETGLPIKGSYDVIREVDRNRHTVRVFCPIIEYDGPEYVGAKREISGRWHRALVTLADHFIEAPLDDHVIVQWRVPAKPWLARDTELSSEKISA